MFSGRLDRCLGEREVGSWFPRWWLMLCESTGCDAVRIQMCPTLPQRSTGIISIKALGAGQQIHKYAKLRKMQFRV